MTTAGPGLYIRVKHRFGPRQTEWLMAAITTLWGVVLLLPDTTMNTTSWVIFRSIMPEEAWGVLMLLLGVGRLGGLFVNGARKNVTPWIRVSTAGAGLFLWVGITTAFALSGHMGTWAAVYPMFAVAEAINIFRASRDAGESDALP